LLAATKMVNDNNNTKNKQPYDIFFSYQSESKELVDLLSKNLKNDLNYKIYFDNNSTTSSTSNNNNNNGSVNQAIAASAPHPETFNAKKAALNLNKKLKHINNSKCVLSLVTKKYCESIECLKEINFAKQTNKPLILLMLEDLNMNRLETSDSNNNIQYHNIEPFLKIDLFKRNENKEDMVEAMIESIQVNLAKLNQHIQSNQINTNINNNLMSSSSTISLNNKVNNESFCDENRCENFIQITQQHHGMMNKKVSQGILSFSNGDKYEGDLVNNKKHGHGVYTYKNGDVYDGEWYFRFFRF
jgi:hypothetical protein